MCDPLNRLQAALHEHDVAMDRARQIQAERDAAYQHGVGALKATIAEFLAQFAELVQLFAQAGQSLALERRLNGAESTTWGIAASRPGLPGYAVTLRASL